MVDLLFRGAMGSAHVVVSDLAALTGSGLRPANADSLADPMYTESQCIRSRSLAQALTQ